ncbi:MAG: substrate-binding domain-containing protein [Steroidobacteraceae bacterium]|jgi:molybdate transport system substrate-binding protein
MPRQPLKLISSMATAELLGALIAQYQRNVGINVVAEAGGGVVVLQRIQAGEAADVVVLAANVIDKLIGEGRLLADSRLDLVRSGIAVAVCAGVAKPSIADEAAVRQAVLAAKTLSFSTGPSGVYLEKLFERWGILEQIRARIVVPPPGVPVGSLVAAGSVELGFQQLSELQSLAGIEILGALPPAIQLITVFSGGISAASADPDAARALLRYLASPAVAQIKQRFGMESA